MAVIHSQQWPEHRRYLTTWSRKSPGQKQAGATRAECSDFFGAGQTCQVSTQLTVKSYNDAIDTVEFLCGQEIA